MFIGLAVPKTRMLFLVLGALRTSEMALGIKHLSTFSGELDVMIIAWERQGDNDSFCH